MSNAALSLAIKGWFFACVTVTAIFFMFGFVRTAATAPDGLTPALLLTGLFLSVVHFFFIATFTAGPAALFIWVANKTDSRYLPAYAVFGIALGWLAQLLFNPLGETALLLLYAFSGLAAGTVYWFVTEARSGPPERIDTASEP